MQISILTMRSGSTDVEGHRAGCADIAKKVRARKCEEPWTADWSSKREAFLDYNSDFIAEADGAEDNCWVITWLPCCELPETDPEPIYTADGVRLVDGMAVWDYDLNPVTIDLSTAKAEYDGTVWFYTSRHSLMDGSRVVTRHPTTGQPASEALPTTSTTTTATQPEKEPEMTTATATRTRKTRKAEPTVQPDKFVWSADDVTVEPPPEPVQEPSEEAVSDAEEPVSAQPATDVPAAPEKEASKGRQPYSREVLFSEAKVSRQYFSAFGIDGGTAILANAGVEVQANKKAESLTLTGPKRNVERAAKVLLATWTEGFAEFNIWRRTDEAYLALAHTGKEATVRYHREQDHLRDWALAHAAETQQTDAS
jgi:hypothetical protein